MSKIKSVQTVNGYSINSSGETKSWDLPKVGGIPCIDIAMEGANVSDEATLAELLAGLGTVKIITTNQEPVYWDIDDLFYFNAHLTGRIPYFSKSVGAGADNDIRYIGMRIPLNPTVMLKQNVYDPAFGIRGDQNPKIEFVLGSDTAAGSDARKLYVVAYMDQDAAPQSYMGAFLDSYTAVANDNFRDIQGGNVLGMFGAFIFGTTGYEDLSSTDAVHVNEIGYAVSRSIKEKVRGFHCVALKNGETVLVGDTAGTTAPNSDYWFYDLGLYMGYTVPYERDMQVYVNCGVSAGEAARLYPLLDIANV